MMRVDLEVEVGGDVGRPGDDQRRPGLVDENGVHLVDDGVIETPLTEILDVEFHVVAEIVKAELVVGAVGDIRSVGLPPGLIVHVVDDGAGGQAEKAVDLAHPLHIAPGQIVVDRHHVHALAGQGIQVDRQGGGQGLALAGLHLGDHAPVQDKAADELHIVMTLPEDPPACLAHHGKGLGQKLIQGGAAGYLLLELQGLGGELRIAQFLNGRLQVIDPGHHLAHLLQDSIILAAKNLGKYRADHVSLFTVVRTVQPGGWTG